MDRRGALLSTVLSLSFVVSLVSPAHAASTGWDPNDMDGRMDLRWVGVYRQDADTVRIGITFWNPVRQWMLPDPFRSPRRLIVWSDGYLEASIYGQGYIYFSTEKDRWLIEWIDAGSGMPFPRSFPVAHPTPYLFQAYLPAEPDPYGGAVGHATGITVDTCDHLLGHPEVCAEPMDRIPPQGSLDPA